MGKSVAQLEKELRLDLGQGIEETADVVKDLWQQVQALKQTNAVLTAQVAELKNTRLASAPAPRAKLVAAGDPKRRHPRIYARDAAKALGPECWVDALGPNEYTVKRGGQVEAEKLSAKALGDYVRSAMQQQAA